MMRKSKNIFYLLLFLVLANSCQQIKQSYQDTINPKENQDSLNNFSNESFNSTSSSSRTVSSNSLGTNQKYESIYSNAEKLDSIQSELLNLPKFKGRNLMGHQLLYFYDFQGGRISLQIQDPDNPENIDEYEYSQGKWQEPVPVKITGNIKLEMFLFPLNEIKFSTAKKVHDTLVEEAKKVEGGAPSDHVYFTHLGIANISSTKWYSSISGSRKDIYIDFDLQGNEISRR